MRVAAYNAFDNVIIVCLLFGTKNTFVRFFSLKGKNFGDDITSNGSFVAKLAIYTTTYMTVTANSQAGTKHVLLSRINSIYIQ